MGLVLEAEQVASGGEVGEAVALDQILALFVGECLEGDEVEGAVGGEQQVGLTAEFGADGCHDESDARARRPVCLTRLGLLC